MTERKHFTITWRIKNFSFCWQEEEKELSSPAFFIEGFQESKWSLVLFPRASRFKREGSIAIYLLHESKKNGQSEVEIEYELSVLYCDGLPLETLPLTKCAMQETDWSAPLVLKKSRVFLQLRNDFLPKDSLTVRCKIWHVTQENINAERCFATTRIEVEKLSIIGNVTKIHYNHGKRYEVEFISASSENIPIQMNVKHLEAGPYAVIIPKNHEFMKYCKCKLYLTDIADNEIVYGEDEFLFNNNFTPLYGNEPVWIFPLGFVSENHLSQQHFEMDNLNLRCKLTYSIGIVSEKIEKVDYSVNMFRNGCRVKEKRQECLPSLKDDLISLMRNAECSDIKLQTKNKTFSAHRIILRARSLYFKTKLADQNNMASTIYVDDLDSEVLDQVLVFLYTDTIENLELENALNLYIASAQYGIPSMKERCSYFLQNNLNSSICCDVLRASDKYQDSDLKKAAQNFILVHEDEVIGSEKWKDLDSFTELKEEVTSLKRMKKGED